MGTSGSVNYARAYDHQLEPPALGVFPDELFLAQLDVGIGISLLWMALQGSLLGHQGASWQLCSPEYTKRTHEHNPETGTPPQSLY